MQLLINNQIDFEWKIIGSDTDHLLKDEFIKKNLMYFSIIPNIENLDEKYFPHSDLIKHYANSDIYINLSRIESFGITFIEALAANVPIISFDSKGANEIVRNNINGYIVKNEVDLVKKK